MTGPIDRDEALLLLRENLGNENLIRHCLATEAVMRTLARDRGEDQDLWGLTGLLHDLDYERTADSHDRHGLVAGEMLEGRLPEEYLRAIKAHNGENNGVERISDLEHLLAAGESITGLIVAVALVYPEQKLEPVRSGSVTKRMRMTAFARSVPRETIMECEKAGYDLDVFVRLSLDAMKGIAGEIGL
ncbi:MAG: HDIG domain-containing protein [Candidatus Fermentibacteraceae bacterium]|nr:HDIG domain-containing protein [Candidatus Fermentibacteraceae bacterium]MBN2609562.1 HDIG domain-containing protein [Candidatus Fermentibacteraceae bacterium]